MNIARHLRPNVVLNAFDAPQAHASQVATLAEQHTLYFSFVVEVVERASLDAEAGFDSFHAYKFLSIISYLMLVN